MNLFTSNAMAPANMNVMSIMTNVLADLTQVKDPFISDDDSFLIKNSLVEEALAIGVGGTITIQERAYILSTNVDTFDFGYSDASARTPGSTKLATVPNIFTIGEKKFYDTLLTQTLESGIYLNSNRYVTQAIIAQIDTLSADYAAKLTRYHQHQAISASKISSGIVWDDKRVVLPYGCQYTPPGVMTNFTEDLDIATLGGIFESLSRMIAPSSLDPSKGRSGFATMNSLIYTSIARQATSYTPVSNEQILRSMSIFGETLQFPTGQYVTLSRYSILDNSQYFNNSKYAIPQIGPDGEIISGSTGKFHYTWLDYNRKTGKWQLVITIDNLTTSDLLLSFTTKFYEPFYFLDIPNKETADGFLLESHGSSNTDAMTWIIDKPDGFKDEDINTHFYKYLPANESPYGIPGWIVNVTLNFNPIFGYYTDSSKTSIEVAKSFSKYNVKVLDDEGNPAFVADTKAIAELPAYAKEKLDIIHMKMFGTLDPTQPSPQTATTPLFPYANRTESIIMWNPQTRYEIPRPIDFTYQGTNVDAIRRGQGLVSSRFSNKNFLGSGPLITTIGPWTHEGAYNIRIGMAHTSAWLSHNFNVATIPIDKNFIFNNSGRSGSKFGGYYVVVEGIPNNPTVVEGRTNNLNFR